MGKVYNCSKDNVIALILFVILFIIIDSPLANESPLRAGKLAYERKDYSTAVKLLTPLAESGNQDAQYNLGVMCAKGEGQTKDLACALSWYERAANQGHVMAQTNLGTAYLYGRGTARNPQKALHLYKRASNAGFSGATHNLGVMYRDGVGVQKDSLKAVHWFEKAIEQGEPLSSSALANMYANGDGISKDPQKAFFFYEKAAYSGDTHAQYNLSVILRDGLFGVKPNLMEARTWAHRAAIKGHSAAMFNLGSMLVNGQGGRRNLVGGYVWIELSISAHNKEKDSVSLKSAHQARVAVQPLINYDMLKLAQALMQRILKVRSVNTHTNDIRIVSVQHTDLSTGCKKMIIWNSAAIDTYGSRRDIPRDFCLIEPGANATESFLDGLASISDLGPYSDQALIEYWYY